MSVHSIERHRNRRTSAVLHADQVSGRDRGIDKTEAAQYGAEIRGALQQGEVEAAYEQFQEWARREARYAKYGYAVNLEPLMGSMLDLIEWMYPRVPRELARVAASAVLQPLAA